MVVALYGISAAMIVGGVAALVQGYGIILVERGWTLVISGTVAAASGAVLLGIAVAVSRLGKVQAELVKLRERLGRLDVNLAASDSVLDPVVAVSSGLLGGGAFPPAMEEATPALRLDDDEGAKREPAESPSIERADAETATGTETKDQTGEIRTATVEDTTGLFGPEPREKPVEVDREEPTELAPSETSAEPEEPQPTGAETSEEPRAAETDVAPAPTASVEPTIIGSYDSGGNRYVMFSDGSIEAETPEGVYRFNSLDELKEFIASGGGSQPRGS